VDGTFLVQQNDAIKTLLFFLFLVYNFYQIQKLQNNPEHEDENTNPRQQ
jgi:hypothetical protein